jgi:Uridine kinase
MAYHLKELNRRIAADPLAFVQESDEAYTRQVRNAAEHIKNNLVQSPVVLLSGPSGSGKTTTALKIQEALGRMGVRTHTVSMDNYFLGADYAPFHKGERDLESPKIMDMDLLDEHFTALSRGEEIIIPKFEFTRQMRNDARGTPLRLGRDEIAIFEGIHALNDDCAGRHPEATKLYISARSDVEEAGKVLFKRTWMRLTRRAVRDYNFRGTDVEVTLRMWANVRRGEKLYISPFKERANIMFDSSLPYEVSVMKNYATPILKQVPEGNPRSAELKKLFAAFKHFEVIDPALVPKDSLLREFIGGGSYKYH